MASYYYYERVNSMTRVDGCICLIMFMAGNVVPFSGDSQLVSSDFASYYY